jgi:myosin-1
MAQKIQRAYRNFCRRKIEAVVRIQTAYRQWREVRDFLRLRDYGHQVYRQMKQRRRFSLLSMRRFLGDYLNVMENGEVLSLLRNDQVRSLVPVI